MNSLFAKIFVYITEILSGFITAIFLIAGVVMMFNGNPWGLIAAIAGPILVAIFFGFAAIFIEIHKDLAAIRKIAEAKQTEK
jgi:hypothetical protein